MSLLLRSNAHGRWSLHTSPHLLPFIGNLFTMPDGRRVVQLAITRHSRTEEDNLSIDFVDRVDQFFKSAFREVVEASREEHEVVLVGVPGPNRTFLPRGARFRRAVMVAGHNTSDWLAAVVAVTWRHTARGPEPLLQVNTPQNSTREIGKASHVSGYVNLRDRRPVDGGPAGAPDGTGPLSLDTAVAAVRRELLEDFAIDDPARSPTLIDTAPFYYPDKENLFFYLFNQEIAPTHAFPDSAQMFGWTVEELLTVRRFHALSNAAAALDTPMSEPQRELVADLVGLNLRAHGEPGLAAAVADALAGSTDPARVRDALTSAAHRHQVRRYTLGRELNVHGLAGLQYRLFFSHLLPTYARIGVPGAAETLAAVEADPDRSGAVGELALRYSDERLVCSLPIEV